MHIVILSIKWHKAICAPDILLSSREHTLTFLLSKEKTVNKTNMGIVTLLSDTPFHPFRKQSINGGWLSQLFPVFYDFVRTFGVNFCHWVLYFKNANGRFRKISTQIFAYRIQCLTSYLHSSKLIQLSVGILYYPTKYFSPTN